MSMAFSNVKRAIEDIQNGKMIILVDDEHRENEGDLIMAASKVTPDAINFMITHARGLVCMPMSSENIERLALPMMVNQNGSKYGTAFTVSIEAATGISTGISTFDRARTIQVAADPTSGPNDIIQPGHIFPLRACDKGVLERHGQTEGSVDLVTLAGLPAASVICEILNEDGTMARMPDLFKFAQKHDLMILTIEELIAYRVEAEKYE